ncbi:MAG: NADP-dependent malic enzyme [Rhodobacteraceae bacterium]|nr:MAG: NADP-dependent malic enzyme [Paracoccaceae bacterium]
MAKKTYQISRKAALDYHQFPKPGKLEVRPTKPLANQRDLTRAYSPGVAEASIAISKNPADAALYTSRSNLVAVVSNGSAVLGLGDIGALAAKPVMEGKAVLFKQFANIDCFDIEVNESNPEKLAEIVTSLEPTFGAINLEDIKAPDCFKVEELCRRSMNIPVFHDDQHGTAIVVGAALLNALRIHGKNIKKIKVVASGGGSAGIACLKMLVKLGCKLKNIWLCDKNGLITKGLDDPNPHRAEFAQSSDQKSLSDCIDGADLFLGLSAPGVLKPDMIARMNDKPIIFALANPIPEILPELVRDVSTEAIIATGRSDYPNQVNNVLCFPFIFRGALDVGATKINDEMQIACVEAIAELARLHSTAEIAAVYTGENLRFGKDYLIPKPFDPRLLPVVATAVAKAAMDTGVATRPIQNLLSYREKLESYVHKTSLLMRPAFAAAKKESRKIAFAEGEDERVLRAALALVEDTNDQPILIGRPLVVKSRIEKYGLPLVIGKDFQLVNPENDQRFRDYWGSYHSLMERRGVTPDLARSVMRTNTTAIASIMVSRGEADSLVCGCFGQYSWHLKYVKRVLAVGGLVPSGALSMMILENGPLFVADTQIFAEPSSQQIADIVLAAARHTRRFGIEPKIALCSHSQFGNLDSSSGIRMRGALRILDSKICDFDYDGEMHSDAALDPELRKRIMPNCRFEGTANVLIFPNTDAASGVRNILKMCANAIEIGPILMGMGNKAHIVTSSITARGLFNIATLAGTAVNEYG